MDDRGRVFSGPDGDTVHDGLVVWDGSIVPRPLGVNPLLTISALDRAGRRRGWRPGDGWTIDDTTAAPAESAGDGAAPPLDRPGLRFTERMAGYWSPDRRRPDGGDLRAVRAGLDMPGRWPGVHLVVQLTLSTDDLRARSLIWLDRCRPWARWRRPASR